MAFLTDNMGGKHETGTIFNKKPTVLVIFKGLAGARIVPDSFQDWSILKSKL